jgi:hypothetical protein
MLDAQRVAFYETRPSIWGISAGGVWDTEDAAIADARRAGTAETFITRLRADLACVVPSVRVGPGDASVLAVARAVRP